MPHSLRLLLTAAVLVLTACPPPSGTQGPQGEPGEKGEKGDMGAAGVQGPEGAQGPLGPQGLQGDVGSAGAQGPAGPQGVQGPAGMVLVIDGGTVVGPPGSSVLVTLVTAGGMPCPTGGVRLTQLSDGGISHVCNGTAGATGPQGNAGAAGPQGAAGPVGPQGVAGGIGPQGLAGPVGPQGVAGVMGPQGVAGPQGAPGAQGLSVTASLLPVLSAQCLSGGVLITLPDAGTTAVCNGATGAQGVAGAQGPMGLQGLVGATGPVGAQGPTGATGVPGAAGPAGAAGAQGVAGPMGPSGPPGQVLYVDGGTTLATDWVEFAGFTAATYTGNLGGIVGANAKCRAEFAGSFFCTASDYYRSEPGVGAPGSGAWVDYERSGVGARDSNACNSSGAWTNGTSSDWANSLSATGGLSGPNCNNTRALACCRAPVKRVFRGFTAATYTGDLGGIVGANTKCRVEFPGSFFCTASDYYLAEPGTGAPGLGAWVDYERSANGARDSNACNSSGAWTNATSSDWANSLSSTGGLSGPNCNTARALACCGGP